jgi:hypothetical protein
MSDSWDPFTAAHQAIFAAFEHSPSLAALVPAGNFIDTTDPLFERFKPGTTAADTPQVKILQGEFALPPFGGNSTSVQLSQDYHVLFSTDVLRIVPLNQLKYQALIALVKAGPSLGLSCVRGFEVSGGRDDSGGPGADKALQTETQRSRRWAAAFTITVHLFLSRQQLAAS